MNIKKFYHKWSRLKKTMTKEDYKFFLNTIDIDGRVGRRIDFERDGENFNSRFTRHFFPSGRCHYGVIFATYLLNKRFICGTRYMIITNDLHSAIIDTKLNVIYDPTYEFNKIDLKETVNRFANNYKIVNLKDHCEEVNFDLYCDMVKYVSDY